MNTAPGAFSHGGSDNNLTFHPRQLWSSRACAIKRFTLVIVAAIEHFTVVTVLNLFVYQFPVTSILVKDLRTIFHLPLYRLLTISYRHKKVL